MIWIFFVKTVARLTINKKSPIWRIYCIIIRKYLKGCWSKPRMPLTSNLPVPWLSWLDWICSRTVVVIAIYRSYLCHLTFIGLSHHKLYIIWQLFFCFHRIKSFMEFKRNNWFKLYVSISNYFNTDSCH